MEKLKRDELMYQLV